MFDIKLLIVEDDPIIRNIYYRVLEKTVNEIYLASNGEEGLQKYSDIKPDLILSDIKMPIMNGLDMIREIRDRNAKVRIIIMSAYGESRYFLNAIETGVKGFLIKPVKNEDLIKIVTEQANDILLERNLAEAEKRRIEAEKELINMNITLEKRVRERTKELELEIAERTNAQLLLRESEEKYRLIYENASDGILLIQNGIIILLNPTMVNLMEDIPRNLIGKPLYKFIKSKNADDIKEYFLDEQPLETEKSFEVMISTKSEKQKWLELKINIIDWDNEAGYLVFASNITLRKLAQLNLTKLNKNLEKRIKSEVEKVKSQQQLLIQKSKLESLGELSAGLAHEINQPLGGISMGLENIIYKIAEGDLNINYIKSKINVLFQDIDRIKNIIEHVRVFSRDQQRADHSIINVIEVISKSISLINRQYLNHSVDLQFTYPEGIFTTSGNAFKLEQVILNMLSNSKSAVDKRAAQSKNHDFKKKIKIEVDTEDDFILIYISDNGIGISDKIFDKIFDPFFTTKDEESGTGLGLSISYGIIKEMNGLIRVESSPQECTKLTIELPLIKE